MGDADEPSLLQSVKAKAQALGFGHRQDNRPILPQHNAHNGTSVGTTTISTTGSEKPAPGNSGDFHDGTSNHNNNVPINTATPASQAPAANDTAAPGATPTSLEPKLPMSTRMKNGTIRFWQHTIDTICYSWINVLLIFVPIGIASHLTHLQPEVIFAMNAVAIIPLAGLLSHATEAVAARLGDTLGALLNVSFGNAVELILFIILLADDQIRVVQAALLGSILANLLLILGMAFLLGGLRFQEQIYNSTVTQMSACMLSLAVMSLLLPTAFHAAFSDNDRADEKTLSVSRGTSVILLLVYILYLLFQLKSHSYMYASTPQHILDEEAHPGLLHGVFESSSSSSDSSSCSSSSSSDSDDSHITAKRIKRALKGRRRRKSVGSRDTNSAPSVMSSPSVEHHRNYFARRNSIDNHNDEAVSSHSMSRRGSVSNALTSGDEADMGDHHNPIVRDFEGSSGHRLHLKSKRERRKSKHKHKHHHKKHHHHKHHDDEKAAQDSASGPTGTDNANKVTFAADVQTTDVPPTPSRRALLPSLGVSSLLTNTVFNSNPNGQPVDGISNVRMAAPRSASTHGGLRRSASAPDRSAMIRSLSNMQPPSQSPHTRPVRPALNPRLASQTPSVHPAVTGGGDQPANAQPVYKTSRTTAVITLIISTALVAVCADFLSEAIEPMVASSGISEAFIGLIILPIVGNAAEHVTAVAVAAKNKMDLAIGVAVGSSIQIAIFITPLIVILGWCMHKDMSLYFNIFETVALFVTVFVINFLVLDGRSNYLEGSLLIAAYVIIAVASFYYPDTCDASQLGGLEGNC